MKNVIETVTDKLGRKHGHFTAKVGHLARGRVKVIILQDGKVVEERPWQNNLILNAGLDLVCNTVPWAGAFTNCAAGSGTTATSNASGVNPATGTTGTFTNDTPGTFDFTTLSAVGDMIQMTSGVDTGVEVRITTVTDANNVVYTPANSIASGDFTVWKTSQTGLTTELKRTINYLTGVGNCGSSVSASNVVHRRTYDFTAEVGSVTYNEVGFSNSATPAANLFSRIKLSAGVPLTAGQALRIIYDLTITLSPTTPSAITASITGWPIAPSTSLDGDQQVIRPGLQGVTTAGAVTTGTQGWDGAVNGNGSVGNEPSIAGAQWISPSFAAIDAYATTGNPTSRTTNGTAQVNTLNTYTALDFFRDHISTFAVGVANRTDFRTIGITGSASGSSMQGLVSFLLLFDEDQTKDSLHTLNLNYRITVGRVLA